MNAATNTDKSNSLRCDPQRAGDFLYALYPDGPWMLTAIVPDGITRTKTFTDLSEAEKFIAKENAGGCNLYYSVNVTKQPMSKKARKEDIGKVCYLHADLDPHEDETADEFKERIWPLIEAFRPIPTLTVDSGNGFQLLWRLSTPITISDAAVIADIEARNYALAVALKADPSTRNIDRILRVPGTVNYPNAKKRERGRTKCYAAWREQYKYNYPLSRFPPHVAPAETVDAPSEETTRDESGSGYGYRFFAARKAAGEDFIDARAAILTDTGKAGEWARRVNG
jgi:hypothetical protein